MTRPRLIAGVDEVGRGPLAGAVVTAAVILDPEQPIAGLADSKKLSDKKREYLAQLIKERALAWSLGRAEVDEIDQLNILQATMLAMQRALDHLPVKPDHVMVDGNRCPDYTGSIEAVVGGDGRIAEISAASILAKVSRDNELILLDQDYPEYGFARHKGYPTKAHIAALHQFGVTPFHRRSFSPVRSVLEQDS